MKKQICALLAVMLAVSVNLWAADTTTTVTNRGQVITVKKLTDVATDVRNLDVYQDTSKYATKAGEQGTIVRWYDFDAQGGTATAHKLLPEVAIPHGATVMNVYIKVLTAVAPIVGSTQAVHVEGGNDVVTAATNALTTAGMVLGIPDYATVAHSIHVTEDRYAQVTFGAAVTAGKFMVVMDYILMP